MLHGGLVSLRSAVPGQRFSCGANTYVSLTLLMTASAADRPLSASAEYRLGHDLVRLVDKSAPDSRTASYTRADVWVETRTETN